MSEDSVIERRVHPSGARGASISLDEVKTKILKGRNDERIVSWTGKALMAAGRPKSRHAQAQVILDAVRRRTMYKLDPVGTEFIASAASTLCLTDDRGWCFPASDCDDRSVAVGACMMSAGLSVKVVAQSFDNTGVPGHVLVAVETERGWERVDPSTDFPVGQAHEAVQEWWIDPMENTPLALSGQGEFVGVGRVGLTPGDLLLPQNLLLTEAQKEAIYNGATARLNLAITVLERQLRDLYTAGKDLDAVRRALRPNAPYDPEPTTPIKDISDFPHNGTWTRRMNDVVGNLLDIGQTMVRVGREALAGGRKIFTDANMTEVAVEAKSSDNWRLEEITRTATDIVFAFVSPAGSIISGIASDGRSLSKEETERQKQTGVSGTLGAAQVIVALVVIGVVAVSAYFLFAKLCHMAEVEAVEATRQTWAQCVREGKCTPQQALEADRQQSQARIDEEKARAANDPLKNATDGISKVLMWLAISGVVVGGIYLGAPLIKDAVESARHRASTPVGRRVRA